MKKLIVLLTFFICNSLNVPSQPVKIDPSNPHYFNYKGKTTILVGSTEHYGAIINSAFNYDAYLNTIQDDGLNVTLLFGGSYFEPQGSYNLKRNTLAPDPEDLLLPWARSSEPGFKIGGNKFDLEKWDEKYFARLTDFVNKAAEKDIIVEMTLFSSFYDESRWQLSPFYSDNNINYSNKIDKWKAQTLNNGILLKYQEMYVRKMVQTLNQFDNVYFQIQNEPWSDHRDSVTSITNYINLIDFLKPNEAGWKNSVDLADKESLEWQKYISKIIVDEEKKMAKKHIIAQCFANFRYPIIEVDPLVSVINFHYALPDAVTWNYGYDKPVCYDETGFLGSSNDIYRMAAWQFMMAGGALVNNLDFSFSVEKPNGIHDVLNTYAGGGEVIRKQLGIMKNFISGFDLKVLKPDCHVLKLCQGARAQAISDGISQFAVYFSEGKHCSISLNLPPAKYTATWINPKTGIIEKQEIITTGNEIFKASSPLFENDILLRIVK